MKDKRLLAAALLLPVTVLFFCAAAGAALPMAQAAADGPMVQAAEGETCVGVPIEVRLHAAAPDGGAVLYQLTELPRLGTAQIEGDVLTYTPGEKRGTDRVSYTAVDTQGRMAEPAPVVIRVDKNRAGLTYADMTGDPAHYAALCLAERGVMTGECIGGVYFFRPAQTVTRSEFTAMAAAAAGLPRGETAQTDFADSSGLSPWARPFVSVAAASGLITGYQTAGSLPEFRGQQPITLAEAGSIVRGLIAGAGEGAQAVLAEEHAADEDWAQAAVSTLSRLELLPADAASLDADAPVTRRTACELLCRAMQRMED